MSGVHACVRWWLRTPNRMSYAADLPQSKRVGMPGGKVADVQREPTNAAAERQILSPSAAIARGTKPTVKRLRAHAGGPASARSPSGLTLLHGDGRCLTTMKPPAKGYIVLTSPPSIT
jgi:hypothetical protein